MLSGPFKSLSPSKDDRARCSEAAALIWGLLFIWGPGRSERLGEEPGEVKPGPSDQVQRPGRSLSHRLEEPLPRTPSLLNLLTRPASAAKAEDGKDANLCSKSQVLCCLGLLFCLCCSGSTPFFCPPRLTAVCPAPRWAQQGFSVAKQVLTRVTSRLFFFFFSLGF